MASKAQQEFFDKLLEEKEFPPNAPDPDTMRTQFANVGKKSASDWIDKAMKLPDKGAEHETVAPPPF